MPIVTIQTPTGGSVQIEAPEGATDDQILRFAKSQGLFDQQPQPQQLRPEQAATPMEQDFIPTGENLAAEQARVDAIPETSLLDKIKGAGEAALTTLTGATTGAAGYLGATPDAILDVLTGDKTPQEALQSVEEAAAQSTYQPKTETGQEIVGDIGETLGVLPPVLGTTPMSTLKGAIPKRNVPLNVFKNKAKANTLLKREIASGNPNIETVAKVLNSEGDIVQNKAAKNALSAIGGGDRAKETISVIERLDPASKKQVSKMLDIIEKGENEPLFRAENRPSDILGKSVQDRAIAINNKNKMAGKAIGRVAEKLKRKDVNIQAPVNEFFNSLSDLGVTFQRGEDGWITPDFSRSKFVGGNQNQMAVLINDLAKGDINFKDAHTLKRTIRDNVDFDKFGQGQIKGESQKLLKDLSRGIDDVLDGESAEYRKANEVFAKTVNLKDKFDQMAGKDIDIFSDMSKAALANKARRLSSNAQSRASIMQTLTDADATLSELGVNFKDNIPAINFVTNRLDDIFKITPDTSFQGGIERGIQGAVDASFSPLGAAKGLAEKAGKITEKSNQQKIDALREMLK